MLVVGSVPADYAPLHPGDDLARCLRYYEILGGDSTGSQIVSGYAGAGAQTIRAMVRYRGYKPVTPTVTKNGVWTMSNSSAQPVPASIGTDGFYYTMPSTAAGDVYAYNAAAGCYTTVEANP